MFFGLSILLIYLVSISITKLFGVIDNRGLSLFVTLTYDQEIKSSTIVEQNNIKLSLHVAFVAIKNGHHDERGFIFSETDLKLKNGTNIKDLGSSILNLFPG